MQKYFHTFASLKKKMKMAAMQDITKPIVEELEAFEIAFAKAFSSETAPVDAVLRYVGEGKGKRLRPMLVFLCAKLFGDVNEATRRAALFAEMVHTATLIHDDVVDGSETRRGKASVNARWNNLTAVLSGDYLLSKAMMLLSDPSDNLILKEMLKTTMAMSEGEILQVTPSVSNLLSPDFYMDIITRKTAMLIRSCCMCGALSVMGETVENSRQALEALGDFGLHLGLVFQMRDDLLDADNEQTVALAKMLLPEYLDKTLKAVDVMSPLANNAEVLASLRELTVFCAERDR